MCQQITPTKPLPNHLDSQLFSVCLRIAEANAHNLADQEERERIKHNAQAMHRTFSSVAEDYLNERGKE